MRWYVVERVMDSDSRLAHGQIAGFLQMLQVIGKGKSTSSQTGIAHGIAERTEEDEHSCIQP